MPKPPSAPRKPHLIEAHGHTRQDEWYWLRDREDPEVLAYLEEENAYAREALSGTDELAEEIRLEIHRRAVHDDVSVPQKRGMWEYYERTEFGREYARHIRRPSRPLSKLTMPRPMEFYSDEQLVLDENLEAEGHDYFEVGDMEVSPDGRLLAWLRDVTGDECFTLVVRDIATGEVVEEIEDVSYGLSWTADSSCLYYVRHDEALRPYQVWMHEIGSDISYDRLVMEEHDERFTVSVHESRTGRWVVIMTASSTTSEVHLIDASSQDARPFVVSEREAGVDYSVEHYVSDGTDYLVIVTNRDGARDFKVCKATVLQNAVSEWWTLIEHRDGFRIEDAEVFSGHLVVTARSGGEVGLWVHTLTDEEVGEGRRVEFGEGPVTCWTGASRPEDLRIAVGWTSMVQPTTICVLDLETMALEEVCCDMVRGYDAAKYRTQRIWATASDGVEVPISLVWRDGIELPAPVVLYGYGSYEACCDVAFSNARLSLLDRGIVYAIAHVRGGGEMGRGWYEQGQLVHKGTTFSDFVTCARHLCDEGWTERGRIAIRGRSAGGLLVGASVNLDPGLFSAVVAQVPFVDAVTTMMDDTIPLTVGEFEEWGNPGADSDAYHSMLQWSPYDNVSQDDYPAMLVTGGLHDPRVGFWEPLKWVQRLRECTTSNKPVILQIDTGAGHFGPSGRYDAWAEEALTLAFIASTLVADDRAEGVCADEVKGVSSGALAGDVPVAR